MGEKVSKSSRQGFKDLGENHNEKLYKVKEVSVLIGESDHVLRHWLKNLYSYIPTQRSEAGYNLFGQESIKVLQTIKRLHREQNYSMRQIEHYLSGGGEQLAPPQDGLPDRVADELAELKAMMEQQKQFNAALIDRLDRQQEYIEQSIRKRDEQLTGALRAIQEDKQGKLWAKIRRFFT